MDSNELKEIASRFGRMGGTAKKKKYGVTVFSDMGKKGAIKRWGKKKEKTEVLDE
jgi:hypothetical protein